jgi:CRISPR-associated protein Cmr1
MPHIPDDAFPRAELGLPIVFHFKDRIDPPDTVLYPGDGPEGKRERMASPLILKPVALQNGQFVPVIVQLKTPPLATVDLRQGDTSLRLPGSTRVRDPQLGSYQGSPLQGRSTSGSAIEAFLAYARSQGFEEVR